MVLFSDFLNILPPLTKKSPCSILCYHFLVVLLCYPWFLHIFLAYGFSGVWTFYSVVILTSYLCFIWHTNIHLPSWFYLEFQLVHKEFIWHLVFDLQSVCDVLCGICVFWHQGLSWCLHLDLPSTMLYLLYNIYFLFSSGTVCWSTGDSVNCLLVFCCL